MDLAQDMLGRVCEMGHQKFNSLRVNIVSARNVVRLRDVGHLIGQALLVEVFLGVVSLVLDHVVGYHDRVEASLLDLAS